MFLSIVLSEFIVYNLPLEVFILYMSDTDLSENAMEKITEISDGLIEAEFDQAKNEAHVQNFAEKPLKHVYRK